MRIRLSIRYAVLAIVFACLSGCQNINVDNNTIALPHPQFEEPLYTNSIESFCMVVQDLYDEASEGAISPILYVAFADVDFDSEPEAFYGMQYPHSDSIVWYIYSLSQLQTAKTTSFSSATSVFPCSTYYIDDTGGVYYQSHILSGNATQPCVTWYRFWQERGVWNDESGSTPFKDFIEPKGGITLPYSFNQIEIESLYSEVVSCWTEYELAANRP